MNRFKLECAIKEHGYTIDSFCEAIGMSKSAFYRKSRGKTEFTLADIQRTIDVLGIQSPMGIFFTDEVSEKTQAV